MPKELKFKTLLNCLYCKMKYIFIHINLLCFIFIVQNIAAKQKINKNSKNTILIISSYNPDTRRMSTFINSFENQLKENGKNYNLLIHNLGIKGLIGIERWKKNIENVLKEYEKSNIAAIILLGQEAWCSYVNQDSLIFDVPFYGCYASQNSIELPIKPIDDNWTPRYINSKQKAKKNGKGGGILNFYDIDKNIDVIMSIYRSTKNIALLTDNSLGGVALQSMIIKRIKEKYPNLNLILLDARKESVEKLTEKVSLLPMETAILLGTFRINNKGSYITQSTIKHIFKDTKLPIFTISGLGLNNIAIGGCIPNYNDNNSGLIVKNINDFYGNNASPIFINPKTKKVFNKALLDKYGIFEYQLPTESIVKDEIKDKLKKTYRFIIIISLFAVIMSLIVINLIFVKRRLKKNEAKLIQAKNKAEESERLKAAFIANMSHEIRTPLNAIVGFSSMIIETDDDEEKANFSQIITTNSDILLNLINDILDLSRIESNQVEINPERVNIYDFFEEFNISYKSRMKDNVVFNCINNKPDFIIDIDKQRVTQVISNFITNAIKFTEEGSITLEYHDINNGIRISVTDTGMGIKEENISKIFERFEKLNTFIQGTGLGLSICKAIVEGMDGEIGVDSVFGEGSTFWVWIPYDKKRA